MSPRRAVIIHRAVNTGPTPAQVDMKVDMKVDMVMDMVMDTEGSLSPLYLS